MGIKTVQQPRKVIAWKGVKCMAHATNGEKGSLVNVMALLVH